MTELTVKTLNNWLKQEKITPDVYNELSKRTKHNNIREYISSIYFKDIWPELDVDFIVDLMERMEWKWLGEKVTSEMIDDNIIYLMGNVYTAISKQIKKKVNEPHATSSTGGFVVTAYVEEDTHSKERFDIKQHIVYEVSFVVKHAFAYQDI